MPYHRNDGTPIDPNDVPLPDLCRLCQKHVDNQHAPDPDGPDAMQTLDAIDASMQVVRCTLTRIDHHLDRRDGAAPPFVCLRFCSRFGGSGMIWH